MQDNSNLESTNAGRIQIISIARALPRLVVPLAAIMIYAGLGVGKQASVLAQTSGEKIFGASCAACHAGGKNIMIPKKPIIGSPKLESKQTFKAYLSKPTPPMPASPKIAESDADLTALYNYCKSLK